MPTLRPSRREDFEVAIVCALPLEYDAISLQFDEFWDAAGDPFGRANADRNTYTTGRIGQHNVVLALLPRMGKLSAATAAANLRSSYRNVKLVLLAGICGGVPHSNNGEILLGDVVISKAVVEYDFGRQYAGGFIRKKTISDMSNTQDKGVRNFLALFDTELGKKRLLETTCHFLQQLQENDKDKHIYAYPGSLQDKLFESGYRHIHHNSPTCSCRNDGGACDEARTLSCDELGCNENYLQKRDRLKARHKSEQERPVAFEPFIHMGVFASGDTVMKSAEHRDSIAKKESVIAFEMEGAGVCEELPCIIVKGVCDYADSHKNKKWQNIVAAVAASATKAILERYPVSDRVRAPAVEAAEEAAEEASSSSSSHFLVPFGRNKSFVGRESILSSLVEKIWPGADKDDCQRTVITGLGGIGKTQIALEAAFRIRAKHPDCSVFWVPALDASSFEKAYYNIAKRLNIQGIDVKGVDIKQLVKNALSDEKMGYWLFILDNADDTVLLFGASGLVEFLPFCQKGSILFTTRFHDVAVDLNIREADTFAIDKVNEAEAFDMLRSGLGDSQVSNTEDTKKLLEFLEYLPLAVRQASAYMAKKRISTSKYLDMCQARHENAMDLLSRNFEDKHRYKEVQNPVATTWLISFNHILTHDPLAAEYLKFMSLLMEKDIPKSVLPPAGDLEATDAIGTLKAYGFITERTGEDSFDMHRLVRLAVQSWLKGEGELTRLTESTIERLLEILPWPDYTNRNEWMKYVPHTQALFELREHFEGDDDALAGMEHFVYDGLFWLGHVRTAERIQRQALQFWENRRGQVDPITIRCMDELLLSLTLLGNIHEEEHYAQKSLKLKEKIFEETHPEMIESLRKIATAAISQGRLREAESMLRRGLHMSEKIRGEHDCVTLISLSDLAVVLTELGEFKEAVQFGQRALNLMEKSGDEHPYTYDIMLSVAAAMTEAGSLGEAESLLQKALQLSEKTLGDGHLRTIHIIRFLTQNYLAQGKIDESEEMSRRTLKLSEEMLGDEHPLTLFAKSLLLFSLHQQGKNKEAEQVSEGVIEVLERVLGKAHRTTLLVTDRIAVVLAEVGKCKEAEKMTRQTLMLQDTDPGKIASMEALAHALHMSGKYEDAEQVYQEALKLSREVYGEHHLATLRIMNNLAASLFEQENFKGGEQLCRQTVELLEKHNESAKNHRFTQLVRNNLEECLQAIEGEGDASAKETTVSKQE